MQNNIAYQDDKTSISPQELRRVMGEWPSGVVAITAMTSEGPVGMAMNSFTSVSLEPPLVGFFPGKSSSTWPLIRSAGRFCINILASHQEHISKTFARKDVDRFAETNWHQRSCGPGLEDAVAWIECELYDEYEAGDHTFVLGSVLELNTIDDAAPLVFHRGAYTALTPAESQSRRS